MDWMGVYQTDFGLDIPLARLPVYFVIDDEVRVSTREEDCFFLPNIIQASYHKRRRGCSIGLPFERVRHYRYYYTESAFHRVPIIWRAGPDYDLLVQQLAHDDRAVRIDYFSERIQESCKERYRSMFG